LENPIFLTGILGYGTWNGIIFCSKTLKIKIDKILKEPEVKPLKQVVPTKRGSHIRLPPRIAGLLFKA